MDLRNRNRRGKSRVLAGYSYLLQSYISLMTRRMSEQIRDAPREILRTTTTVKYPT
jgi:hypothetical protein